MTNSHRKRVALTLVEVLIALAILAVLIGLLLPALVRVRAAARRVDSSNRMRQLIMALPMGAGGDKVPLLAECYPKVVEGGVLLDDDHYPNYGTSLMNALTRHAGIKVNMADISQQSYYEFTNRLHQSPADPSYQYHPENWDNKWSHIDFQTGQENSGILYGNCSYLVNAQAAQKPGTLNNIFRDGLSNTVYIVEGYARTNTVHYLMREYSQAPPSSPGIFGIITYSSIRRATFADERAGDVHAFRDPQTGHTIGRLPQQNYVDPVTIFQVNVPPHLAKGKVPYSPYSSGLLSAWADGSVRMVRVGVDESVFWGCVTPAGGEVANLD